MAIDIGTGTLLTITGYTTSAIVRDVRWTGISRDVAETTVQTTTGGRTFIPADTYDPGSLEFDIAFDPTSAPPFTATAATITVNWAGAGSNWSASGFWTDLNLTAPYQGSEVMSGTVTFKFSGTITT